jgi:phosphonate degradation associated HDIG domain protein
VDNVDTLIELYHTKGTGQYGHEAVTQTDHALQSAALAEAEGAAPALIAAALLHDVGHLLHKLDPATAGRVKDDTHEEIAWGYLKAAFGPAVAEPVRLHVDAKRYLCAVEPEYFSMLSPASVLSLKLQGGKHAADEAEAFRRKRFADDAVRLRRWDDQAKVPDVPTRRLRDYADLLRGLAL